MPGCWRHAAKLRAQQVAGEGEPREPVIVEYARSFFPIILIVFLFRSFAV